MYRHHNLPKHVAHNWQFCIRTCSSLPAHTIIWLSVIIWTTTITHSVYSILIQHGYGAGIHRHCWLQVKDHLKKLVLKCYLKLCTVSRVGFLSCVCAHHYVQLLYTTDNPQNCPQRRNESQPQVTCIEYFGSLNMWLLKYAHGQINRHIDMKIIINQCMLWQNTHKRTAITNVNGNKTCNINCN